MTKPLITLPCKAQELENALHAVCDHDGLWDAKIVYRISQDPTVPWGLSIETETKGETK
jgi:hypothetical protein